MTLLSWKLYPISTVSCKELALNLLTIPSRSGFAIFLHYPQTCCMKSLAVGKVISSIQPIHWFNLDWSTTYIILFINLNKAYCLTQNAQDLISIILDKMFHVLWSCPMLEHYWADSHKIVGMSRNVTTWRYFSWDILLNLSSPLLLEHAFNCILLC